MQPRDILFIDEIHRLAPAVEEILYPAMEDFQLDLIIGEGPGARSIRIDLPPFTLVGATTRSGLITRPLRERFGIPLRLLFYEAAELAEITFRSAGVVPPTILNELWMLMSRAALARAGMADIPLAIENFSAVIRLRPNEAQPYVERGSAYLEQKDYQASMEDCAKAIALDPKLAGGYNLRGTLERAEGDGRKALEDFTRAISLKPDLDNYYQRGATYQLLGDHKRAIADFNEAILYSPFSAHAYFARAESKRVLGDNSGAQRDHLQGRILDGR